MSQTDRKRKKTENQAVQFEEPELSQVPNLERRAAHFARADPKGLPSSTPTGSLNVRPSDAKDKKESWPGPFATARAMIQQREDAKKSREDAILVAANGVASAALNLCDMDEFDVFLHSLKWEPATVGRIGAKRNLISSLSDICVQTLVTYFKDIDDSVLEVLSTDVCSKFAVELCRRRQFSCEVALQLAVPGSEGIYFPECSSLSDDTLVAAMEKVSRGELLKVPEENSAESERDGHGNSGSSLRILQLRNCGHGFTDQVAKTVSEKHARGLEILELTGCYRLNEAALCCLLQQCSGSLKSLDLSCNSRLGVQSMSLIANMSLLSSLKLDHATPFTNSMIMPLTAPDVALKKLEHLSLAGLIGLDDEGCHAMIVKLGPQLRSLSLKGCVQLTDESLIRIREHCRVLDALDIGGLGKITKTALLGLFIEGPLLHGGAVVEIPILFDNRIDVDERNDRAASRERGDPTHASNHDSTLSSGSSSIGRLTSISLSGLASSVDDDVVIQLCLLGGSMRFVDLGGCSTLTSRSLTALQLYCGDSLETLDLSFVRNFAENSLGSLVDRAHQLRSLSLWGCTQLTRRFFDGHRNDRLAIEGRMDA